MSLEIVFTPEFTRSVERQAAPLMERDLMEIKLFILEEFEGPKSGRIYRRRGRVHQASAPGEPPAIDTGTLRASISDPHVAREGRALVGRLVIATLYASFLERGTPRMAKRPFAQPAVEEILRRRRA